MLSLVFQCRFRHIISRKTPCIILIDHRRDPENQIIHSKVKDLCKKFPYVLCYKISFQDYLQYHANKTLYNYNNVLRFENDHIESIIDGRNLKELYYLFWQVYADSCAYHLDELSAILLEEHRIEKSFDEIKISKSEIDLLADITNGIICKAIEKKKNTHHKQQFLNNLFETIPKKRENIKKKLKESLGIENNISIQSPIWNQCTDQKKNNYMIMRNLCAKDPKKKRITLVSSGSGDDLFLWDKVRNEDFGMPRIKKGKYTNQIDKYDYSCSNCRRIKRKTINIQK